MRPRLDRRAAGVLLHPTSLPGPHGVGDLGPTALDFVDLLAECGQTWWQMLPIVPPGMGESPYMALSAFAGNPLLLSLESLSEQGWLDAADLAAPAFPRDRADFEAARRHKWPLLRKAFAAARAQSGRRERKEQERFDAANADWLDDFALFCALRRRHREASWTSWDADLRRRKPAALERARRELDEEVRLHKFLQRQFARQWTRLREHGAERGVGLIGDVPIFVAHDSADVWARPELFWLDPEGRALKIAGVPPDYFSKTGQRWGNPLYRWDVLRRQGYAWWIARLRSAFAHFDAVRLDHFIGFHNYWEIPGHAPTAERGRWVPGPGADFFEKARRALEELPIIAEDLGVVTPGVKTLRDRFRFPGLKVLQMAFGTDPEADGYKPYSHTRECVVYTGTHDTDTTVGWFNDSGGASSTRTPAQITAEHELIRRYLGTDGREIHWDMIRAALQSVANTAIVPVQDLLGLGSEARMNLPGTALGNWAWRMAPGALTPEVRRRWRRMTETYGRLARPEGSKRRRLSVTKAAIRISAPPKATT